MKYGYMRVSTKEQNEERQWKRLVQEHIPEENIFLDKKSGKNFERLEYKKMISVLNGNSELYVTSLDRLGRNYKEIIEQWKIITKEIGASIIVLDMPLLDTRQNKDLLGTFISDIVLSILSYVAETERSFIRTRQEEGIKIAKEKGIKFGRPKIKKTEAFEAAKIKWLSQELSLTEAALYCGMSKTTFWRFCKNRR